MEQVHDTATRWDAQSITPATPNGGQTITKEAPAAASSCLLQRVRDSLRASGYPPLWRVECRVTRGEVTMAGEVPSYYLKQVAQELVLRLRGAERIQNLIQVQWPSRQ